MGIRGALFRHNHMEQFHSSKLWEKSQNSGIFEGSPHSFEVVVVREFSQTRKTNFYGSDHQTVSEPEMSLAVCFVSSNLLFPFN